MVQEGKYEVIIVDSWSDDATRDIVSKYADKMENLHLYLKGGRRGESRNYGVSKSQHTHVAFIDGDIIANPFWLREMRKTLEKSKICAGRTINIGFAPFEELGRVELIHRGYDVTYPSCNLCYERQTFEAIGGFDPAFVTAEDIDLNYRAAGKGADIVYNPGAVVYHRTRSSLFGFLRQAFWNGFGRKQLTLKHGVLWKNYKISDLARNVRSPWAIMRLSCAMMGYMACKMLWDEPDGWRSSK
jgi:GT2 family glycosyltransferase